MRSFIAIVGLAGLAAAAWSPSAGETTWTDDGSWSTDTTWGTESTWASATGTWATETTTWATSSATAPYPWSSASAPAPAPTAWSTGAVGTAAPTTTWSSAGPPIASAAPNGADSTKPIIGGILAIAGLVAAL